MRFDCSGGVRLSTEVRGQCRLGLGSGLIEPLGDEEGLGLGGGTRFVLLGGLMQDGWILWRLSGCFKCLLCVKLLLQIERFVKILILWLLPLL